MALMRMHYRQRMRRLAGDGYIRHRAHYGLHMRGGTWTRHKISPTGCGNIHGGSAKIINLRRL